MKLSAPRALASTLVLLASLVLLSACDDSDDNDGGGVQTPPATSEVPPSASESVDGFISYLKALVASSADTLEPVDTAGVTPPVDDKSEPAPVN